MSDGGAMRDQDEQLFDADWLEGVRRDMVRFARLQLRDETLAEDVVQEALAAAFDKAREFAGRSAMKTWIFAILKNKIVEDRKSVV